MTVQVATRNNSQQAHKPLPNPTPIKQNQKVSQANTSGFNDFTDLQVKVTRQAIENIRGIAAKLKQDIMISHPTDTSLKDIMIFNAEVLKYPYKTGVPSVEDMPESVHNQFDLKQYDIHFTTPHAIAEAVAFTNSEVKKEFPSLDGLQKEVSQLKLRPHEDKLYGLLVNGVKFAFFPPTKDQQKLATFESLNLKDLLKKMNAIENADFNESTLISTSRILSSQVLKLTREYADQAIKNFPEAFEPQAKVNWTLSKVEAVVKAQV